MANDADFKTLREVGKSWGGLEKRLGLMTAVFAGAVILAAAAFGYLIVATIEVGNTVAALDERTVTLKDGQEDIRERLDAINSVLESVDNRLASADPVATPYAAFQYNMLPGAVRADLSAFKAWSEAVERVESVQGGVWLVPADEAGFQLLERFSAEGLKGRKPE